MRKRMLSVAAVVALAGLLGASEDRAERFKYEEGRAAVRAYEQAMQEAVKQYAAAVQAARKEYASALDAALKVAMTRGDLDEANRLNAAKKTLEKELAAAPVAPVLDGTAAPTEKLPALVGTWSFPNGTSIVCRADGTYARSWDRDAKPGIWRRLGERKFMLGEDVIELSPDLNSFANPNPKAKGQIIRRVTPLVAPPAANDEKRELKTTPAKAPATAREERD